MPKVSIIVLVNGVEKYIERCADSLYNQTIDDVESLLFKNSALQTCVYLVKNKISK
jgi:glycosyltransferase involved in cell wall biosynthesis